MGIGRKVYFAVLVVIIIMFFLGLNYLNYKHNQKTEIIIGPEEIQPLKEPKDYEPCGVVEIHNQKKL